MQTCLTETQDQKLFSIAFPAIGTGNLGYPRDIVAEEMCNAVINFSKDNPDTCLKNVEFVIYEKDNLSIQVFETEIGKRAKEVINLKPKTQRKRHGGELVKKTFGSDSQKEVSVEIGPIKLRMYQGDITLADVDAIVNGTDSEMDLNKGEVSRAIKSKLGGEFQRHIENQKKTMQEYGMAVTSNGDKSKMPSKYIIHVNIPGGNYKRKIMSIFKKAEELGLKTVALPALGTGQQNFHQRKIEEFAQEVFDALNRMSSEMKNLSEVHIIIFDQEQALQFIVEMEKCFESQGSKPKGWLKAIVDTFRNFVPGGKSDDSGQWRPVLTDKPDDQSSVTIVVFADNQRSIDAGIRKLENLVNDDFKTKDIRDPVIRHLSQDQMKALQNLKDEFDVEVNIDREGEMVTICGTNEALLDASDYVNGMLRDLDRNKLEAEYVSDVVMWYFVDNSDSKNELCDYPKNINLLVEKAYRNKQPDVKFIDLQGTQYTIDFSTMEEYPSDDPTDVVTVTRRDKINDSTFEPPPEWTAMKESENLVVVQVPPESQEYLAVIDRFQGQLQTSGIKSDIIKLERIQNKMLYQQYVAKKKLLDSQNPPGTKNERELWHGTAVEAVNSVNALGFNRSYCGANAALHGNGVYFAVDAEYSARTTYSKPDPKGHKRIYLCKVLTGEFTLGKKDMRVPPAKDDRQPHILYDSVVYPLQDPEMFIIFNDTQGYPAYLITFIKHN